MTSCINNYITQPGYQAGKRYESKPIYELFHSKKFLCLSSSMAGNKETFFFISKGIMGLKKKQVENNHSRVSCVNKYLILGNKLTELLKIPRLWLQNDQISWLLFHVCNRFITISLYSRNYLTRGNIIIIIIIIVNANTNEAAKQWMRPKLPWQQYVVESERWQEVSCQFGKVWLRCKATSCLVNQIWFAVIAEHVRHGLKIICARFHDDWSKYVADKK